MGLTPEQVRDRLRAEGYPPDLLDSYLPGGVGADSSAVPSDDVFAAVRALGIVDSAAVDSLRSMSRRQRRARANTDSAFLDTLSRLVSDDSTREAVRRLLRNRQTLHAQVDSGFTVYGQSLFTGESSQFNPTTAGVVDASYLIGPGDHLVLFLTGDVQASYQLDVTREGFVVVPNVGQLSVAGLTKAQLDDLLYSRLGRVYSGVRRGPGATTQFALAVSRVGVNQVIVTGDVVQPASYQISRAGTLMTALYAARGPTESGSLRAVQVRRGDRLVGTLDVYDYLLHGDASRDIRLENGDVVFVPPRGAQVRVVGAVLRPATYELKPGETLASLIQMAGGFTAAADRRTVQIDRIVPPNERTSAGASRRLFSVASDLLATGNGPQEPLENGDVVRVFEIPRRLSGRIGVDGNVWSPGIIAFAPGMHLSDALKRAGGLRPDTYLGQILIERVRPDSSLEILRAAARDTTGVLVDDPILTDGDWVYAYSQTQFRPYRYVTISGAVKKSGRYRYQDGLTLRDLLMIAGGLKEGALLSEVEIARLPENRAGGVTAVTARLPIDSTYLFERPSDGGSPGARGSAGPAGRASEIPLRPYDAVLILRQPGFELERTVSVQGEIRYPGPYSLRSKSERISDIIARAGGLTQDAYADGVVFVRRLDNVGRVGIDLSSVMRDPKHVDNQILTDGDSIYVPRYAAIVSVRGAVNSPLAVAYVRGANIDYYVRGAGGGTPKGDARRAYVMQPNGKVESRNRHLLLFTTVPKPQAGSTVFVPDRDSTDRRDLAPIIASMAQVLGTIVTLVAITRR